MISSSSQAGVAGKGGHCVVELLLSICNVTSLKDIVIKRDAKIYVFIVNHILDDKFAILARINNLCTTADMRPTGTIPNFANEKEPKRNFCG